MVHSYYILEQFSEKQRAYTKYLLDALGHESSMDTEQYLGALYRKSFQYKSAGNRQIVEEAKQDYYSFENDVWKKKKYTIIDFLHDEYQIKRHNKYKVKSNQFGYTTATDLANYVYCPVGYSISRTFQGITVQGAKIGKEFHELSILRKKGDKKGTYYTSGLCTESNRAFFEDFYSSKQVYAGHYEKDIKYFSNKEENFAGDPDYVFQNAVGLNYIVEEKFISDENRRRKTFYPNHKIQLASYIKYLKNFNAKYGYLVYWIYSNNYGEKSVVGCEVLKITLDRAGNEWLENVKKEVENFRSTKKRGLAVEKLNHTKCGSCVHSLYCGHKNRQHNEVTYPYDTAYHNLYPAEFPDILKKENK